MTIATDVSVHISFQPARESISSTDQGQSSANVAAALTQEKVILNVLFSFIFYFFSLIFV